MNAQVVLFHGSDMLLQRRAHHKFRGGLLSSVGGRHEEGETPEQTARRELGEEAGLVVDQLHKFAKSKTCTWYWAHWTGQRCPQTHADEVAACPSAKDAPFGHAWVPIDAVKQNLIKGLIPGLQHRLTLAASRYEELATGKGVAPCGGRGGKRRRRKSL